MKKLLLVLCILSAPAYAQIDSYTAPRNFDNSYERRQQEYQQQQNHMRAQQEREEAMKRERIQRRKEAERQNPNKELRIFPGRKCEGPLC